MKQETGSHSLAYKKFQDTSIIFPGLLAQQCLNIQTNSSYSIYIQCNSII